MVVNAKEDVKLYKRSLIIDAAAKLFYEKGFQKTTLDDIAFSMSMTKPFIYSYFENKYALLEALFDVVYDELYVDVEKALDERSGKAVDRLVKFVHVYVTKNVQQQRFTSIMLEEEKNLSAEKIADIRRKQRLFDKKLARLIEAGIDEGTFIVKDPALASLAISGMVRWVHRWYSPKGRLSLADLCDGMSDLALKLVGYKGAA